MIKAEKPFIGPGTASGWATTWCSKKYADGGFQRVWATPSAAAEKRVNDSPGCLLAARWRYSHDMH